MPHTGRHITTPGTPEHAKHLNDQFELVEHWRVEDFTSEEYHAALATMMYDGYNVLQSMIKEDSIYKAVKRLCFTDLKPTEDELLALGVNEGERNEIVWKSLDRGASLFTRRGMRLRIWTPERGASLETYFVNGCIMKFKDVFTAWREQRMKECSDDEFLSRVEAGGPAMEDAFVFEADFETLISGESERNRKILRLRYRDGLEYKQIAERLAITEHVVRGVLNRFKLKVTKVNID